MQVRSLHGEDPLKKEWQPTPVFLPREFHAQRSLVDYSPQGHKESDMTEQSGKAQHGMCWSAKIISAFHTLCIKPSFWSEQRGSSQGSGCHPRIVSARI